MKSTKVRPLLARPGARYTCFGDGLCCTDIHGLGPLTKSEFVQIRLLDEAGADFDDGFDDRMLNTAPDGGCHFLLPDLRCGVHAEYGPEAKPDGCRRFPLGLVATPEGGRITTRHRCPCRTLGDRPEVTAEATLPSIVNKKGEPRADEAVNKIRIGKDRIPFAEWVQMERELLGQLQAGVKAEEVLDAEPFPPLKKRKDWDHYATEFVEALDGSSFGNAIGSMGEAIRALRDSSHVPRFPRRSWASAFDRAEQRAGLERTEDALFNDWIADEIWSLEWNGERGWDIARIELATRLAAGRFIAKWLQEECDCRPDRAAAEAIMVIELVGESEFWSEVVNRIKRP
ncbi:MAG: hypothetical protein ACI9KE_003816 [Polyangiales bacterium]|jgi:hypothetical protein